MSTIRKGGRKVHHKKEKFKEEDYVELKIPKEMQEEWDKEQVQLKNTQLLQLRSGNTDKKPVSQPQKLGQIIENQGANRGLEMRSGEKVSLTLQAQQGAFPEQGIRIESPPIPVVKTGGDEPEIVRISPLDLETLFIREGICYQWVNRLVEYFLAANPEVKCGNTREQKVWNDFQATFDWRELIKLSFQHKFIYGNAVWRWIFSPDGKKKISLDWIDPKYFDAVRTPEGRVRYNMYGKPIAFVHYIKFGQDTSWIPADRLITQTPKFTYQSGQGILLKPEEIIHYTLNRVGDFWWGIGLLEPIYNFVKIKQNADEGYGEMMQRAALPRMVGYVGDESHPPTQEAIDDVWEKLSDLESKHQFAGPYYYKLEILEPKHPERLQLTLKYLVDGIVAGLGGPKPFITGSGEATNRATLADQKLWLERSLKMEQEDTSAQIEKSVLSVIAKQNNFRTMPKLVWTETSTESLESKTDRLVKLAKAGLLNITPELEEYIKNLENLPTKKR